MKTERGFYRNSSLKYATEFGILIEKLQKSSNTGGSAPKPPIASGGWNLQAPIVSGWGVKNDVLLLMA